MSRWGLRDLGELCDHLHTAYNSPSRRSPSSTEAPTGAASGPPVLPARRAGAASGSGRRCRSRWQTPSRGVQGPPGVRFRPLGTVGSLSPK